MGDNMIEFPGVDEVLAANPQGTEHRLGMLYGWQAVEKTEMLGSPGKKSKNIARALVRVDIPDCNFVEVAGYGLRRGVSYFVCYADQLEGLRKLVPDAKAQALRETAKELFEAEVVEFSKRCEGITQDERMANARRFIGQSIESVYYGLVKRNKEARTGYPPIARLDVSPASVPAPMTEETRNERAMALQAEAIGRAIADSNRQAKAAKG